MSWLHVAGEDDSMRSLRRRMSAQLAAGNWLSKVIARAAQDKEQEQKKFNKNKSKELFLSIG